MSASIAWLCIAGSILLVLGYEALHAAIGYRHPDATAPTAHAVLRADWVEALSVHEGSEIVAIQTLRNSLMSATITASTAALALMGTLTLTVSANNGLSLFGTQQLTPPLLLVLLLLLALFASYICSAMAVRYFNHAGFVLSLPVGSEARRRHHAVGQLYIRRAGLLYGWGLRCFLFVAPIVAGLINIRAMPAAAVALLFVLHVFDLAPAGGPITRPGPAPRG